MRYKKTSGNSFTTDVDTANISLAKILQGICKMKTVVDSFFEDVFFVYFNNIEKFC